MKRGLSLQAGLAVFLALALAACQDTAVAPDEAMAPQLTNVAPAPTNLTDKEALGRAIYFDTKLSLRQNQACATCHAPDFGFSGPNPGVNLLGSVYMGSVKNRSGNRRPPTAAYATQSPPLFYDGADEVWVGGNFWDGRATGETLGSPAAEQALGPFLNPVEQGLPDQICVLYRIAVGPYADLWPAAWNGDDLRDLDFPSGLDKACRREGDIDYSEELRGAVLAAYDRVGLSIAAFEGSKEVNAFTSKFDAVQLGMAEFTEEEAWGQELFNGEKAMCSACHLSDGFQPLFTDYTYDNLGIPANPLNPIYDEDPGFVDNGIGVTVNDLGLYGAVKVPTLRNVAKAPGRAVKSYGHNGVFKSLEQIVHFYNTRDVLGTCASGEVLPTAGGLAMMGFEPECWPAPEVGENVNDSELGDLQLTLEEEQALVAFMKTLSDGYIKN
jgi:cytochrome c peroxidase